MTNQTENKICQNCKIYFTIEPEDFSFYEKIKVPAPTFCPECRFKLRYAFRNNMSLYKRNCDLCNTNIISMYHTGNTFKVFCKDCFYGDGWDPADYGQDYDFTRPFFEQWKELSSKAPRINLIGSNKVNSEYTNHAANVKNIYLSFSIGESEDCYFMGPQCTRDKNCSSCSMTRFSEWSYMLVDCESCYKVSFSQNCDSCLDSSFLYNCRNCSNCIGCTNLRNKNYCIFNEQYTREDYFKIKEDLQLSTFSGLYACKEIFENLKKKTINKYAILENTDNCTGDSIINSRNCKEVYAAVDSENTKYGFVCNGAKDSMDLSHSYPSSELCYHTMSPIESSKIYLSCFCYSSCFDLWYCDNCYTTSDSFGSISLRNKKYCILNKQYEKEEYSKMIEKIKSHMNELPYVDKIGRVYKYGDFFPSELSIFSYNETPLQDYYPLDKESALASGYSWKDKEEKSYSITITAEDLHNNSFADEEIIHGIIECKHRGECNHNCTTAFRVLPDEFNIYKSLGIPAPDMCHNCRYIERINLKNPMKLWHRSCMKEGCNNEFETSFAPERPEIVYCEKCYQQEVI